MILHYNAFISYRHAPLDSKVAAEVQTQLERFRIPAAIRKTSGMKRINRIFRDKDELLITSDLNDTIQQALQNSDFLIVICSHATKESVWVQREIEFFLTTHPKERVLTVVAEGEPSEVVPQILQQREVTVTLDDGSEETVTVPMEPLSCDYRADFRKARKEELPRLAAAILGCSYDELRRRQRQYRMRRMALAMSAVAVLLAALSVYYAWSASQIRGNYLLSLKNQSRYLSAESVTLLEEGDRLGAILLALEALPKDGEDQRPVIPEAEHALSQAVNAYIPPNTNWYAVDHSFSHGGVIDRILTNTSGSHLIVGHSLNTLTVWDTAGREKVFERVLPNQISHMALSGDDHLLVLSGRVLYCYDYRSGNVLWQFDSAGFAGGTGGAFSTFAVAEGKPLAALKAGDLLVTLDTATGTVRRKVALPVYQGAYTQSGTDEYDVEYLEFSPDAETLFAHLNGTENHPAIIDLNTETVFLCPMEFWKVSDVTFTPEGNPVFIGMGQVRTGNYWVAPMFFYGDAFSEAVCVDPKGQVLWQRELPYTEMPVGPGDQVIAFSYPGEAEDIPAVACSAGETLTFLASATGEPIKEISFTSAIVGLSYSGDYFSTILTDGMLGNHILETGTTVAADYYIEGIDLCAGGDATYVSDAGTGNVLRYVYGLHDENFRELTVCENTDTSFYSFYYQYEAGGRLLLSDSPRLKEPFLLLDRNTRSVRLCAPLTEEFLERKNFLGLSADGQYLLFEDYAQETFVGALSLETMEYTPEYYKLPGMGAAYSILPDSLLMAGALQTADGTLSDGVARVLPDGTWEVFPVAASEAGYSISSGLLLSAPDETAVLFRDWSYEQGGYHYRVLDLQTGESAYTERCDYEAFTPKLVWAADSQSFFLEDENCIRAFGRDCREHYRISCEGMSVSSLFVSGEELLVLYGTDSLCRYRVSDGAFLGKTEVSVGTASYGCRWDASQPGTLAILSGNVLNIIDTERWVLKTQAGDCFDFDLEQGFLFSGYRTEEGWHFGTYDLYDYRALIAMAEKQLGGITLSGQMRAQYGLQ